MADITIIDAITMLIVFLMIEPSGDCPAIIAHGLTNDRVCSCYPPHLLMLQIPSFSTGLQFAVSPCTDKQF